jgi:hypothetical protein
MGQRLSWLVALSLFVNTNSFAADLDYAAAQQKVDAAASVAQATYNVLQDRQGEENSARGDYNNALAAETQASNAVDSAQQALDTNDSQITRLDQANAQLANQLDTLQGTERDLNDRQRRLQDRRAQLGPQIQNARREVRKLEQQLQDEKDESKKQELQRQLRRAKERAEQLENEDRQLDADLDRVARDLRDNTDSQNQNRAQQRQNSIQRDQLDRQRAILTGNFIDAKGNLQQAKNASQAALNILNVARQATAVAANNYQRDYDRLQSAKNYYNQVVANYNKAKADVVNAANTKGGADGAKEGQASGAAPGQAAGKAQAQLVGNQAGTIDGKVLAKNKGYREGRQVGATDASVAESYAAGIQVGIVAANQQAVAQDFPVGYNAALGTLYDKTLEQPAPLDITEKDLDDAGAGSPLLNPTQKTSTAVAAPAFKTPVDPAGKPPTAPNANVDVAPVQYTNHVPNCDNLVLPEFGDICNSTYTSAYEQGYSTNYRATFLQNYKASYNGDVGGVYQTAYNAAYPDDFSTGKNQGARDQGVLDGYAQRQPVAQKEQIEAGQQAFAGDMSAGFLIRVKSLDLAETSGDGLFTPGEKVKVQVVVENFGGKPSPKGQFKLSVTGQRGTEKYSFVARDLPSIPGGSRVQVQGVVTATLSDVSAKTPLLVEGRIDQKDRSGNYVAYQVFSRPAVAHFPLELETLTQEKTGAVKEKVSAKLVYRNLTKAALPETEIKLLTSPRVVEVEPEVIKVPAVEPDATVEVKADLTPGIWAGSNVNVKFRSAGKNLGGNEKVDQLFPQLFGVARDASLALFDANGNENPSGAFDVVAGTAVTFYVQFRYHRNDYQAVPFQINPTQTSDPGIVQNIYSSGALTYNGFGPGLVAQLSRYSYNVAENLKGKSGWVMIEARENGTTTHALQVMLNIK